MDLYEVGECEVHLRNGPLSKRLVCSPSQRHTVFLAYDDSDKGKAVLVGLRKDMADAGWEIEHCGQTEAGAKARARAKEQARKRAALNAKVEG